MKNEGYTMVIGKLPVNAMERLLKKAGAYRVSASASAALKEVLEDRARTIAENAINLAHAAGRKTVKASDIKIAAQGESVSVYDELKEVMEKAKLHDQVLEDLNSITGRFEDNPSDR